MPLGKVYKDYTGQKYGHLTFLCFEKREKRNTYWRLQCDCGNTVVYKSGKVIDGENISCGCIRWKDYSGQKYGKLTFVERAKESGNSRWKLVCDCGREILAKSDNVIGGGTRSCGCSRRQGEVTFISNILSNYARRAPQRGLVFTLTHERFVELITQPCFYCGEENSNTWTNKRTGEQFHYNGIDRVDNDQGYIEGNVVSCCGKCNFRKREVSAQELINWAYKIVAHQEHKKEIDYAMSNLFQKVGQ
jgi:hypothetical protein